MTSSERVEAATDVDAILWSVCVRYSRVVVIFTASTDNMASRRGIKLTLEQLRIATKVSATV